MKYFHHVIPGNRIPKIPKTNASYFKRLNMNRSQNSSDHTMTFMQET